MTYNRALWELVDAKFRSGNSIPVERIVITLAEYEAVINRPVAENTDEVVCEVMAIVRNMDGEPILDFTGEGDLYEIPDGTPVWLLSGGNFDKPDDGWMSLYTKPQTAILERPVVVGEDVMDRCVEAYELAAADYCDRDGLRAALESMVRGKS
jgi:hypothetical protein